MSSPRRILVTGAGGFVGRHLLRTLRAEFPTATLLAATRATDSLGDDADEVLPFDLQNPESMLAMVVQARPEAVVHLAAQASVAASFADPVLTWHANLLGTVALGEAVLHKAPEARFLLASSAEVYGLSFQSGLPLAEDAPLRPANPYAAAKAAADLAVGEMALRGLRSVRLRAFNHVGPGQGEGFVVAGFASQLARIERGLQQPILRVGALDRWRDFLDVREICAAYTLALRASLPAGTVLNIASGTPRSIGEVLEALLDRAQVRPVVEVEATRLRPTDIERVQGDAEQAKMILGWAPCIPWEETLDAVMEDARRRAAAR